MGLGNCILAFRGGEWYVFCREQVGRWSFPEIHFVSHTLGTVQPVRRQRGVVSGGLPAPPGIDVLGRGGGGSGGHHLGQLA